MPEQHVLTDQERKEADALIFSWENFVAKERDSARLSKDAEEILLACYTQSRDKFAPQERRIGEIVRLITVLVDFENEIEKWCDYTCSQRGVGDPPPWFGEKISKICKNAQKVFRNDSDLIPVATDVLRTLIFRFPDFVDKAIAFMETGIKTANDLEICWQQTQNDVRKLLKSLAENACSVRGPMYDALRVWAESSEARREYLQSKGVYIAPVNGFSHAKAAKPVAMRPIRQEKLAPKPVEPKAKPAPEEPWQIFCVTPTGTELESFDLMLSGSGERLAQSLARHYRWTREPKPTMSALRRIIKTCPSQRTFLSKVSVIPHGELNWFSFRVGKKHRIMARIKDENHSVFLMADHRTELRRAIGKRKNES